EGRTLFTGLLEGRARLELLADADVVVYPSEHEIFGLVPLEALLSGTPVVVTSDSGCGEVIASTGGGLVVQGDADALRSAIDHILESPAHWRAAAAEAAKRVRAMYAPGVVCAQLEQVYLDMVAAR
ncbi:MAG: glycosyltransferase family 4 protein, partial [Vicinamibacterales bacterium]